MKRKAVVRDLDKLSNVGVWESEFFDGIPQRFGNASWEIENIRLEPDDILTLIANFESIIEDHLEFEYRSLDGAFWVCLMEVIQRLSVACEGRNMDSSPLKQFYYALAAFYENKATKVNQERLYQAYIPVSCLLHRLYAKIEAEDEFSDPTTPATTEKKDQTQKNHPLSEGQWSNRRPLSRFAGALDMDTDTFKNHFSKTGLYSHNRQSWQVRLDTIPDQATRKKLESI